LKGMSLHQRKMSVFKERERKKAVGFTI